MIVNKKPKIELYILSVKGLSKFTLFDIGGGEIHNSVSALFCADNFFN